jgi:hypothetical protein
MIDLRHPLAVLANRMPWLGIPDLNLPMYWGFIFLTFVFCPTPISRP